MCDENFKPENFPTRRGQINSHRHFHDIADRCDTDKAAHYSVISVINGN